MRIDRTEESYNDGLHHGQEQPLPEGDEIVRPLRSRRGPGAVGPGAEGKHRHQRRRRTGATAAGAGAFGHRCLFVLCLCCVMSFSNATRHHEIRKKY